MKIPRFLHRLYAWFFGYFWTACPRCGRMFGGHEKNHGRLMINEHHGFVTCCPEITSVRPDEVRPNFPSVVAHDNMRHGL